MTIRNPLLILSLCVAPLTSNAQLMADRGHGHAMIQRADTLLRSERRNDALTCLAGVHPSDSLYERTLLLRMYIMIEQDDHAGAEGVCRQGLALHGLRSGDFIAKLPALLYDQEKYDAALLASDSAIRVLPGHFRVRHLRAHALAKKGDRNAAFRQAMDNARRFPYQRDGHLFLANIALNEDRTSQAALALMMAQLVTFGDEKAEQVLATYDQCLNGALEPKTEGYDMALAGDDLEEVDMLIRSRVAMDRKYKVRPDLDYPMCRQSHLLFKALAERKGGQHGFYERLYGPLAAAIIEQGRYEGFVYHCLASSTNTSVRKAADKNKAKVIEFRDWLTRMIPELFGTFPEEEGGPAREHVYNEQENLLAHGPAGGSTGGQAGNWTVFNSAGRVSGLGDLDGSGKRTGHWTEWNLGGVLMKEADYSADVLDGTYIGYHDTGLMMDSMGMRNGVSEGLVCKYYRHGGRMSAKTAVAGEWTGTVREYRPTGSIMWEYGQLGGRTEGTAVQHYANGDIQYTGDFQADQNMGTHKEYHPGGTLSSERSYLLGKAEGPYRKWHLNGQLAEEGTLKADVRTGERRLYDEWGTLKVLERYGDAGKLQGLREEFNDDGTRTLDMEFNKGLLMRYTYYARDGHVLSQGSRTKGRFQVKGYDAGGWLSAEGVYLDEGAKDGPWKYYYADGTLRTEDRYLNGEDTGDNRYFDPSGKLVRKDAHYTRNGNTYLSYTRYNRVGTVVEEGQFKDGQLEGMTRNYFGDGTLRTVEYYVDGEKQGWQEQYDALGRRASSEHLDNGALTERVNYDSLGVEYERIRVPAGPFELVTHYANGAVAMRSNMLNGWFQGKVTWYYPNGHLMAEGAYLNGDRHGKWVNLFANGARSAEVEYVMGNKQGMERTWDRYGTLLKEATYTQGQVTGAMREYHANGKPAFVREHANDEYHGRTTSYTWDGVPSMVRFYLKGRLWAYGSPAADGSVKDTVRLGEGVVHLETRFPNGKIARSMTYRNDELDGDFVAYHLNGQEMDRSLNTAGVTEGISTEYFPNGQVMLTTPFVNGEPHGVRIAYWDNGQVRERTTFVQGTRHGPMSLYDRTGKRSVTYHMRNDDVERIEE